MLLRIGFYRWYKRHTHWIGLQKTMPLPIYFKCYFLEIIHDGLLFTILLFLGYLLHFIITLIGITISVFLMIPWSFSNSCHFVFGFWFQIWIYHFLYNYVQQTHYSRNAWREERLSDNNEQIGTSKHQENDEYRSRTGKSLTTIHLRIQKEM